MWRHLVLLLFVLVASSIGGEVKSEFKKSFAKNCDNEYTLTCLKLDVINWVEKLNENDDYSLLPGVSLVRENISESANTAEIVSNLAREFPDDPEARLDGFLMKKVTGFVNDHAIKFKLWSDDKDVGTARGKGGKGGGGGGGGMGALLAAGAMMKGGMMAMGMAAIAAMAGKALAAALLALMLAALSALKKGDDGGGSKTYEVHAGGHGGHGWKRSLSEQPLPVALQPGYKPYH